MGISPTGSLNGQGCFWMMAESSRRQFTWLFQDPLLEQGQEACFQKCGSLSGQDCPQTLAAKG